MAKKQNNKTGVQEVTKIAFSDQGWEDYTYWAEHNPETLARVNELIKNCLRDPFKGIGKPEPLKHDLSGFWSRRISLNDRLVYCYQDGVLTVIQCRFHY